MSDSNNTPSSDPSTGGKEGLTESAVTRPSLTPLWLMQIFLSNVAMVCGFNAVVTVLNAPPGSLTDHELLEVMFHAGTNIIYALAAFFFVKVVETVRSARSGT